MRKFAFEVVCLLKPALGYQRVAATHNVTITAMVIRLLFVGLGIALSLHSAASPQWSIWQQSLGICVGMSVMLLSTLGPDVEIK